MARKSTGTFGKLVLIGFGALIGAALTQKKEGQAGTSSTQAANMKESIVKGLDRLNEQSGGMVDKVKPSVNKAVEAVKGVIESQQQMMDKEKDALDKAKQTLNDEVDSSKGAGSTDSSSTIANMTSSDKTGSGTSGTAGGSSSPVNGSAAAEKTPTGGTFGGSTTYSESLKKNHDEDKSKNN